jgi:hypothetical protein
VLAPVRSTLSETPPKEEASDYDPCRSLELACDPHARTSASVRIFLTAGPAPSYVRGIKLTTVCEFFSPGRYFTSYPDRPRASDLAFFLCPTQPRSSTMSIHPDLTYTMGQTFWSASGAVIHVPYSAPKSIPLHIPILYTIHAPLSSPYSSLPKILDNPYPRRYTTHKPRLRTRHPALLPILYTVPTHMSDTAPTLIPSDTAVGYLIAAGGNSKLAAVAATRELKSPVTEAQLLASITNDPNSLAPLTQQLNLLLILNTVESLRLSHHAFIQALPNLSAKDAAATYIKLLQTLTAIARPDPSAIPNQPPSLSPDQILDQLPEDVQTAIRQLMAPEPNPNP